ncbi:hypothetical protein EDB84DRAFT_1573820, partial [Lactarius hengduanensis]
GWRLRGPRCRIPRRIRCPPHRWHWTDRLFRYFLRHAHVLAVERRRQAPVRLRQPPLQHPREIGLRKTFSRGRWCKNACWLFKFKFFLPSRFFRTDGSTPSACPNPHVLFVALALVFVLYSPVPRSVHLIAFVNGLGLGLAGLSCGSLLLLVVGHSQPPCTIYLARDSYVAADTRTVRAAVASHDHTVLCLF